MAENPLIRYIVVGTVCLLLGAGLIQMAGLTFTAVSPAEGERDVLFQASTIDALLQAAYDGTITFGELERHGDFGIACGDRLDGEVVGLDGDWYRIRTDGEVYPINDTMTTPFASVTFFDADQTVLVDEPMNLTDLETCLDSHLPSKNLFYAIRVDGTFTAVRARSVPVQEKPYPRLVDVTANQTIFLFENVTGTAVGFWTPALAGGINVPGYHLHFISDDRTGGGHVLDLTLGTGTVHIDTTPNLFMALPTSGDFCTVDLSGDLQEELDRVEK
jgi:acetolactate decarboxylase